MSIRPLHRIRLDPSSNYKAPTTIPMPGSKSLIQVCFPWTIIASGKINTQGNSRLLAWVNDNIPTQHEHLHWEYYVRSSSLLNEALDIVPCPLDGDYFHVLFTQAPS